MLNAYFLNSLFFHNHNFEIMTILQWILENVGYLKKKLM